MAYLRSFTQATGDGFTNLTEKKRYATTGYSRPGEPYKDGWDVERGDPGARLSAEKRRRLSGLAGRAQK